jgi:hypothetical protein
MAGRQDLAVVVRAGTEQLASDLARGAAMLRAWAKQVEHESPRVAFGGGDVALRSMRALQTAGARVTNVFRDAASSVTRFGSRVASTALGMAAYQTGVMSLSGAMQTLKESVNLAADLEQTTTAFEVMLGSGDKARRLVDDLRTYAKETPFRFGETTDAARQLMAYGFAADQVIPALRTLGDISAGLGGKMPLGDAAYLAGTLKTQGRAYTKDIWQFTNRGVELLPNLAKHFGVLDEEMRGLIEDGRVGFVEVWRALEALRGPGGRFENMMGRQAKTMKGLFEIASDSWEIAKTSFGQVVIEETGLKDAARDFESFSRRVEAAIVASDSPVRKAIRFVGDLAKSAVQVGHDFGEAAARFAELKINQLRLPDLDAAGFGADLFEAIVTPIAEAIDWVGRLGDAFQTNIIEPLKAIRGFANDNWAVNTWAFGRDNVRAGVNFLDEARQGAGRGMADWAMSDAERRERDWGQKWFAGGWTDSAMRNRFFGDRSDAAVSQANRYARPLIERSLASDRYGPPRAGESKEQIAERYRELTLLIDLSHDFVVDKGFKGFQPQLDELLRRRQESFMAPFGASTEADLAALDSQFWRGTAPDFARGYSPPDAPAKSNADMVREAVRQQREAAAARAQGAGFFASLAPRIVEEFGQRMGSMAGALSGVTGVAATATAFARPSNELQFPDRPSPPAIELANRLRGEYDPMPALSLFRERLDEAVRHKLLSPEFAERGYRDEVRSVAERLGIGTESQMRLPSGATVGSAEDAKMLAQFHAGAATTSHEATVEQLLTQIRDRLEAVKGSNKAMERQGTPKPIELLMSFF